MDIEKTETQRGFDLIKFKDRYNSECSIQKSSLATEDAIWFGITKPDPKIMTADAYKLGLIQKPDIGWMAFDIPKEVSISTRMHLTKEMVAELLPILTQFVETGEISDIEDED